MNGLVFGPSMFRITGKQLQILFGFEWIAVWDITVVENREDLAIEYDSEKDAIAVVKRNQPRKPKATRTITDKDIVMLKLENGKTVTMPLTNEINHILKELCKRGMNFSKGKDVTRETPYKDNDAVFTCQSCGHVCDKEETGKINYEGKEVPQCPICGGINIRRY